MEEGTERALESESSQRTTQPLAHHQAAGVREPDPPGARSPARAGSRVTAATTPRVGTSTESPNRQAKHPVPRGGGERAEEELPEQRGMTSSRASGSWRQIRELSGSSALGRGKAITEEPRPTLAASPTRRTQG